MPPIEPDFPERLSIRLADEESQTRAEGPGLRYAIWFQGCSLKCPGCCNPHMLDPQAGREYPLTELLARILAAQRDHSIRGVTLLGGEPFDQAEALLALVRNCRKLGLDVLVFSGFTLEELRQNPDDRIAASLKAIDVLVDGRFHQDEQTGNLYLRGSKNQRLHFLGDRLSPADFQAANQIEITLENGEITLCGFPSGLLDQEGPGKASVCQVRPELAALMEAFYDHAVRALSRASRHYSFSKIPNLFNSLPFKPNQTLRERIKGLFPYKPRSGEYDYLGDIFKSLLTHYLLTLERWDREKFPQHDPEKGFREVMLFDLSQAPIVFSPAALNDFLNLVGTGKIKTDPSYTGNFWDEIMRTMLKLLTEHQAGAACEIPDWNRETDPALYLLKRTQALFLGREITFSSSSDHESPTNKIEQISQLLDRLFSRLESAGHFELMPFFLPFYLGLDPDFLHREVSRLFPQYQTRESVLRALDLMWQPVDRLLAVRFSPLGDPWRPGKSFLFRSLNPLRHILQERRDAFRAKVKTT